MKTPLVTIIIPSYNYGTYLLETLRNIQKQTIENWECIIIDDGSKDNTRSIVAEFIRNDDRFVYVFQKNSGLSAARNTGLSTAKGEFIQFLDADDLLSPRKLELQAGFMQNSPHTGISYTDAFYFKDSNTTDLYKAFHIGEDGTVDFSQTKWIKEFNESGIRMVEFFIQNNLAPVNSMLIRKDVFEKVGDFNKGYRSLEDWDFWSRCAFHGIHFSIFHSEEAYSLIRVHSDSMTFNREKMNLFFLKLQIDTLDRFRRSKINQFVELYKAHKNGLDEDIRQYIRQAGLLNLRKLIFVHRTFRYRKLFKLYVKALINKKVK